MPVRPVEQAEPVGEPHAGQVHAIIDGPVEPAMVGEQELGAEQADAGRIQENIACQGVQRVRETFRRVLARRRLRRDDEDPIRGLRDEAGASFGHLHGFHAVGDRVRLPLVAIREMTCAGFQIREERVRVHVRVVQASPMGASLFHDLRIVAGQMAYPVLRVVDGGGEPAAGDRQHHPRLGVLFEREIMTVQSGSPP